jgi:phenol hydroxylase P4 protein
MTFADFKAGVLSEGFNQHPDFENIKWDEVEWNLNGESITPTDDKTLEALGFDHKSLLRFKTPGLNGWKGTGV